jgi:hypothetical protein
MGTDLAAPAVHCNMISAWLALIPGLIAPTFAKHLVANGVSYVPAPPVYVGSIGVGFSWSRDSRFLAAECSGYQLKVPAKRAKIREGEDFAYASSLVRVDTQTGEIAEVFRERDGVSVRSAQFVGPSGELLITVDEIVDGKLGWRLYFAPVGKAATAVGNFVPSPISPAILSSPTERQAIVAYSDADDKLIVTEVTADGIRPIDGVDGWRGGQFSGISQQNQGVLAVYRFKEGSSRPDEAEGALFVIDFARGTARRVSDQDPVPTLMRPNPPLFRADVYETRRTRRSDEPGVLPSTMSTPELIADGLDKNFDLDLLDETRRVSMARGIWRYYEVSQDGLKVAYRTDSGFLRGSWCRFLRQRRPS